MNFTDTHCHIHFPDYELDANEVLNDSFKNGVNKLIAVGCSLNDSELGIEFANKHENVWASIGLHPHEASEYVNSEAKLQKFRTLASKNKVIAIGETGLDYHYMHSSKKDQEKLFRYQLELASEYSLPLIFHVRDAFTDFFKILNEYKNITGVVHSFTSDLKDMNSCIERGLYIGVNGIATFTKNEDQLEAYKQIPLKNLLLETDAPFLTPTPYRGTICQPKHVVVVAEFLAKLRGESLSELCEQTNNNTTKLFGI